MVVLFCMLQIMCHSIAVYSPVAHRPFLYRLRHHINILPHIHKNHLKPQLPPAIVANRRSLAQGYSALDHRSISPQQTFIVHELESAQFGQFQHLFEHIRQSLLHSHKHILEGIHLDSVIAEIDQIYNAWRSSLSQKDKFGSVLLAGREIQIAEEGSAENALLVEFLIISASQGFGAVVTIDVDLAGWAFEAVTFFRAFPADGLVVDLLLFLFRVGGCTDIWADESLALFLSFASFGLFLLLACSVVVLNFHPSWCIQFGFAL